MQAVISASQIQLRDSDQSKAAASVYIPTPDASYLIDYYDTFYNRHFKRPRTYIRFSLQVEDCSGPAYCMDDRDVEWLASYNNNNNNNNSSSGNIKLSELEFETLISEFERITDVRQKTADSQQYVVELDDLEASLLTSLQSDSIKAACFPVHKYWKQRRMERNGRSLIQKLKFDEAVKGEVDPYICFRRRDVRPIRKTRKTDVQSLQKLRQLRAELETARAMLETVARRERMKQEQILLEQAIFEQKLLIRNAKREFQIPDGIFEDARLARKKANKLRQSSAQNTGSRHLKPMSARKRKQSISEEDFALKDPVMLAIETDVNVRRNQLTGWEELTETGVSLPGHPAANFFVNVEGHDYEPNINATKIRRRIGRGGRLLIDRYRSPSASSHHRQNISAFAEPAQRSDIYSAIDDTSYEKILSFKLLQLEKFDLSSMQIMHQSSANFVSNDPKKRLDFSTVVDR